MKTNFKKKSLVCLTLFFCCVHGNCAQQPVTEQIQVFVVSGSISNLNSIRVKVESLWPKEPLQYFQANNQLEETLDKLVKTNSIALKELEALASQALSRKCPTNSIDVIVSCFEAKQQIAKRLFKDFSPNISDALVLAEFLGEVRANMIHNYHRLEVDVNVMPPLMPTNNNGMGYFSGMTPNAISDPVARAAYKAAIDANSQNEKMNDFQFITLPELNRTITLSFSNYLKALALNGAMNRGQFSRLVRIARFTEEEIKLLDDRSD